MFVFVCVCVCVCVCSCVCVRGEEGGVRALLYMSEWFQQSYSHKRLWLAVFAS